MYKPILLLLACGLLLAAPSALLASNLLTNPGFENNTVPYGTTVSATGACRGGGSAASNWSSWINSCPGDLSSVLLPTTLPGGDSWMMNIRTNGAYNGIFQIFFGAPTLYGSAWLFLNSGCAGIGTGNGPLTGIDITTCVHGQWEHLEARNGTSPASEFIIYSTSPGGADFFVDNASVSSTPSVVTPEPATFTSLALGIAIVLSTRKRKLARRCL
jgi:hypothetical protein